MGKNGKNGVPPEYRMEKQLEILIQGQQTINLRLTHLESKLDRYVSGRMPVSRPNRARRRVLFPASTPRNS